MKNYAISGLGKHIEFKKSSHPSEHPGGMATKTSLNSPSDGVLAPLQGSLPTSQAACGDVSAAGPEVCTDLTTTTVADPSEGFFIPLFPWTLELASLITILPVCLSWVRATAHG